MASLRRLGGFAAASLFSTLIASPAAAQVMQPSGEVMPTQTGEAELALVRSRGFMDDAVTLEGLFLHRGEMLDPVMDAKTVPGSFSPLCGFTGELVLRGAGCMVALGWYNVDPGGAKPPNDEIYPLVPADPTDPMGLACQDNDFCPLATMETTQVGQHQWTPRSYPAANIRSDPRYEGGQVGFALIGNMNTNCRQTKFSQAELNDRAPSGEPWVTTLIYQSTAYPDAFYIAFEDLPTSPDTWKGQGGAFVNDGDFNDFVFFVTGLTCKGAGQPCTTTLTGACAAGLTDCTEEGAPAECRPVVQPSPERCDNVDNDCDGTVDEEAPCPDSKRCFQGKCVASCSSGEFRCPNSFECNPSGVCVDVACQAVTCAEGEVCIGGQCRGACQDVVCPIGQECQLGRCVDLCAGVTCDSERVCERGICVQNCGCRECGAGRACHPDGRCVEAGCETQTCGVGQVCVAGTCTDACTGANCPGNAPCTEGACGEPPLDSIPGSGSGGMTGTGGGIQIGVPPGQGGSIGGVPIPPPGSTGTPGSPGPAVRGRRGATQESSCALGDGSARAPLALAALAAALFGARRRRARAGAGSR